MQTVKTLALLVLLCLSLGCSPYSMEEVRIAFEEGDFDAALIELDAGGKGEAKLPYLFERGLVAHYGDRFDESNRTFELAEITSDDLYTKSVSREALSLLTSDNLRSYAGSQYERLLIHYYRAFNYVYLNMPDDALVECRKRVGCCNSMPMPTKTTSLSALPSLRIYRASSTNGRGIGTMPSSPIVGRKGHIDNTRRY